MQGKVEICGVNTSKLKVLTNEQTMALLRRAKAGDSGARHMTRAHSRAPRRFFKGHTSVSS